MFYEQLTAIINQSRSSDIVILAGDLNAQVGKLSSSGYCLGSRFALPSQRTDNGERLLQFYATNRLFSCPVLIFNAIQDEPLTGILRDLLCDGSQIDHIVVSFWWRGCGTKLTG